MSNFAEKVKGWYEAGIWTLEMVRNAVRKGRITRTEYYLITGEDFATT